jgi:hypothetical protein
MVLYVSSLPPTKMQMPYFRRCPAFPSWRHSFYRKWEHLYLVMASSPPSYCFSCSSCLALPKMFCSVRWALLLLALLQWADARTGKTDLSWSMPGMHSCFFACYRQVLVGETPSLAWFGVSAIRHGSRTMVRNALTRASPTQEHDRC